MSSNTFTLGTKPLTVLVMARCNWQALGFLAPKRSPRCYNRAARGAGIGRQYIDTSDFYGPHVTNQIIREAYILTLTT